MNVLPLMIIKDDNGHSVIYSENVHYHRENFYNHFTHLEEHRNNKITELGIV